MGSHDAASSPVRSAQLVVRLTHDERDEWHAAARGQGYARTATWVRDVVADAIDESPPPALSEYMSSKIEERADDAEQMRRLKATVEIAQIDQRWRLEVTRVGSNLNQISRNVNVLAKNNDPINVAKVRDDIAGIRNELAQMREDLERYYIEQFGDSS